MTCRVDLRDDRGQVAGLEALPFSVLVLTVGTLLIASAWAVVDTKATLTVAGREGGRTYAEAGAGDSSEVGAVRAARSTVANLGRDPARLHVDVSSGAFARCARVIIRTSYRLPVLAVPWLGHVGPSLTVKAVHSELVDPYRSGLPGRADCAS